MVVILSVDFESARGVKCQGQGGRIRVNPTRKMPLHGPFAPSQKINHKKLYHGADKVPTPWIGPTNTIHRTITSLCFQQLSFFRINSFHLFQQ